MARFGHNCSNPAEPELASAAVVAREITPPPPPPPAEELDDDIQYLCSASTRGEKDELQSLLVWTKPEYRVTPAWAWKSFREKFIAPATGGLIRLGCGRGNLQTFHSFSIFGREGWQVIHFLRRTLNPHKTQNARVILNMCPGYVSIKRFAQHSRPHDDRKKKRI